MPQSLSCLLVHAIFSTKGRVALIDPVIELELYPYLASVLKTCNSPALAIGGVEDHIHLLFNLSRTYSVAKVIEDVKSDSSKWIKKKGLKYSHFYWQNGYGSFTIGRSNLDTVKQYIANQKSHHTKITFQDEYREFLHKYEIEYDERYVWD